MDISEHAALRVSPRETDPMNRILTLALILGAVVALGGIPSAADGGDPIQTPTAHVDIQVDVQPGAAFLSIHADPGSSYAFCDAMGMPVAEGIIEDGHVALWVGTAGVGPDGLVLHGRVNEKEVYVTDPDWEWN